jgi:hypothetical protein
VPISIVDGVRVICTPPSHATQSVPNAGTKMLFSMSLEDAQILERHGRAAVRTRPLADRWWPPLRQTSPTFPKGSVAGP